MTGQVIQPPGLMKERLVHHQVHQAGRHGVIITIHDGVMKCRDDANTGSRQQLWSRWRYPVPKARVAMVSCPGLPPASWGTKPVGQPAGRGGEGGVAERPHTAPVARRFSAVFAASARALPAEAHVAPARTPSLDAIVLSRGPGPYMSPELQARALA